MGLQPTCEQLSYETTKRAELEIYYYYLSYTVRAVQLRPCGHAVPLPLTILRYKSDMVIIRQMLLNSYQVMYRGALAGKRGNYVCSGWSKVVNRRYPLSAGQTRRRTRQIPVPEARAH